MHAALFVATIPDDASEWSKFLEFSEAKMRPHNSTFVRVSENAWLLSLRDSAAPLGQLVFFAEQHGISYGILPFEREPQWLPAGFDPKPIRGRNV